jgi:LPS export ABC transporter protein LptC
MRRSRLRAGLLVVVAIALAGIGYRVWRNVVERTPRSLAELGVELLPEVAQHIQNFHRVKVKNGHMVWEIKAEDAQYYEKDNSVVVRAPEVSVYTSAGTLEAWLTSKDGRLALEGEDKEVSSVTLTGAVVVWLNDLELQTDVATYERERDLITAPGPVVIKGRDLDVHAQGMEVDVTPQRIRLLAAVHTVLRSNAEKS